MIPDLDQLRRDMRVSAWIKIDSRELKTILDRLFVAEENVDGLDALEIELRRCRRKLAQTEAALREIADWEFFYGDKHPEVRMQNIARAALASAVEEAGEGE